MVNILFVCHGNICRSTMAEFVMKKKVRDAGLSARIFVGSAATSTEEIGSDIHRGTKRVLKEKGIPFESRHAVQVRAQDYKKYDYIVLMDRNNLSNIKYIIKDDPEKKISLLLSFANESGDIADPWYTGDFEQTYEDVQRGCDALMEKIKLDLM